MKKRYFLILFCAALLCGCSSDPVLDDEQEQTGNKTDVHTPAITGLSEQDANAPVGFATAGTTPTGGEGGEYVIVSDANSLSTALAQSGKLIIYVKGEIETQKVISVLAKDKTVLGLPGSKLSNPNRTQEGSGILYFKNGSDNIILRNLTFCSEGAYDVDGWDNLCIDGTTNIWVDHCDFQDGVDGNFDCKNASDNIAVTWCRFRYLIAPLAGGSGGSNDHRFTNLWGSGDSQTQDRGHLRTTFQFCWWDEGCRERMPRVRFGQVHIANCLYKSSVTNYCIGLGIEADVYVEKSVFSGVNKVYEDKSEGDAKIRFIDCEYTSCKVEGSDIGSTFVPEYSLSNSVPVGQVEEVVSRYAGATLNIAEP